MVKIPDKTLSVNFATIDQDRFKHRNLKASQNAIKASQNAIKASKRALKASQNGPLSLGIDDCVQTVLQK